MNALYLSKQKVVDRKHVLFAYDITFKDTIEREYRLSTKLKETAQLILNSIASSELNKLIGIKNIAFINIDENSLSKGILDILDKERFILNISENIDLTPEIVTKIIAYKKRGFRLSIEHFDSSLKMLAKFKPLYRYIDIIKMDIQLSNPSNLERVVYKLSTLKIKLLAQNVQTKDDYIKCFEMNFEYFQGEYVEQAQIVEVVGSKEPAQFIILQLMKIIKENNSASKLEFFIKQQPDLSFKLIQFFNNLNKFETDIKSLTQVITLMGRDKLLRWLLVYLYSEVSQNTTSKTMLQLAIKRAKRMEEDASKENKDKAYLAGMFSMLGSIFETDLETLMEYVNMDRDITMLVLEKKGIFASSLMRAEIAEKRYLKKVMLANFEKLSSADLIYTLEDNGVLIEQDEI